VVFGLLWLLLSVFEDIGMSHSTYETRLSHAKVATAASVTGLEFITTYVHWRREKNRRRL